MLMMNIIFMLFLNNKNLKKSDKFQVFLNKVMDICLSLSYLIGKGNKKQTQINLIMFHKNKIINIYQKFLNK